MAKASRRTIGSVSGLLAVFACSIAVAVGSAGAAQAPEERLPISFRLGASAGYELTFYAQRGVGGGSPNFNAALILLRTEAAEIAYGTANAKVTATSIDADFGLVAQVHLRFHATGGMRSQPSPCGADPIRFAKGRYEGVFKFHGEEGFAEASTTSVKPDYRYPLETVCEEGSDEETRPSRRGAEFDAVSVTPPLEWPPKRKRQRVDLRVNKNRPAAPARFLVSVEEDLGTMLVKREIEVWGKPGSFTYPRHLGRARLEPPTPFTGSATFVEVPNRRWRGDLGIDFPGHSGVALTGRGIGAELFPARLSFPNRTS